MSELPTKETFASLYGGRAPWDIGRPQAAFVAVADQVSGSILDAGCGTGDNALFFAGRGQQVTGIDYLDEPIARAKRKAADRGLSVEFLVKDALTLGDWAACFDSVLDCGLFHTFDDGQRASYVAGLAALLNPHGRLFLLCFSDEEPPGQGPRRITQAELRSVFAHGWTIHSITAARFEIIADAPEFIFSEGGPKAWFTIVSRA